MRSKAFQAMDDTLVYVEGGDGNLWRDQGDMTLRPWAHGHVAQFQALDSSLVFMLGKDGNLRRETGDISIRTIVDGNVAEFQTMDGTLVYVMASDRNVWREHGDMSHRTRVDGNLTSTGGMSPATSPLANFVADWRPIALGGGVPVGGWANLTITPDGAYNFSGTLHDSGFPNYDVVVLFAVRNACGSVLTFGVNGNVSGTVGVLAGGSRDFTWETVGTNDVIQASWSDFAAGWNWHAVMAVNTDPAALWNNLISAIGEVAKLVQVVGSF